MLGEQVNDRRGVRTLFLVATVSLACTFDGGPRSTAAGQPPEPGKADDPETSGTSNDSSTGESGVTTEPTPDPTGESTTQSSTSSAGVEGTDETSTSAAPGSSGDRPDVDCVQSITVTQHAQDAELTPPMVLGESMGIPYAFSDVQGAGEIRFTFQVSCPSNYRVFGRVRDDDPSTHQCCDPDSFEVQAPGGVTTTWFYGCDTEQPGFSWVALKSGTGVGSCEETTVLMLPLSAGTHEITLHNREPAYGQARAGIASLTLTNDPDYTPG